MADDCSISPRKRPPEVVKSAVRVLEILELFDRSRQPLMVGEIAAALQYPQSSTSALLRSLVKIGYLTYDVHKRTFVPTQRVMFLGGWQSDAFFVDGPVLEIAQRIAQDVGFPAGLFRRNHTRVQWLHTVSGKGQPSDGVCHDNSDLLRSSTGYMLLAGLGERDIQGLVRRINSDVDDLPLVMPPRDVFRRIDEIRRDGYACVEQGERTTISVPVPFAQGDPVVITLFAQTSAVAGRMNHIMAIVRETIAEVSLRHERKLHGGDHAAPIAPLPTPVRLAASR